MHFCHLQLTLCISVLCRLGQLGQQCVCSAGFQSEHSTSRPLMAGVHASALIRLL